MGSFRPYRIVVVLQLEVFYCSCCLLFVACWLFAIPEERDMALVRWKMEQLEKISSMTRKEASASTAFIHIRICIWEYVAHTPVTCMYVCMHGRYGTVHVMCRCM